MLNVNDESLLYVQWKMKLSHVYDLAPGNNYRSLFRITHIIIIVVVRWYLSLFRIKANENFHAKLIRNNLICGGALSFFGATRSIDQNR